MFLSSNTSKLKFFIKMLNSDLIITQLWVLQYSDPIIQLLNDINKKACQIYCNIRHFNIIEKATS